MANYPEADTTPARQNTVLTIGRVINPNKRRKVTEQERAQTINEIMPECEDIRRRKTRLPRGYVANLAERMDLSKNAVVNRLKKAAQMIAKIQTIDFKRGRPTRLSEAEEEAVVQHLTGLNLSHNGMTIQEATGLVNEYLRRHGTTKAVTRK